MPYFPKPEERAYTCQGCGGRFIPTGYSCCVNHPPGTCCHYGEKVAETGQQIGPDNKPFTNDGAAQYEMLRNKA